MIRTLRFKTIFVSAVLCLAGGLGACTSQEVSNSGTGGTPSGVGGTAVTGSGGGGGSSSLYPPVNGTACLPPLAPLITDFTYDSATAVTNQVHFGDDTLTFSGGEFIYPETGTYPLTSDVTQNSWHVQGMVGDYSGMGLVFDNCSHLDASAYKGISFKVSGTVQGSMITVEVDTLNDTLVGTWLMAHGNTSATAADPGRCVPAATAVNQYAQSNCVEPTKSVPVTATPTTVTLLWSDFTTGKPKANVEPADISAIRWILPNPTGVATTAVTAYPLDIVIDDLSFVP